MPDPGARVDQERRIQGQGQGQMICCRRTKRNRPASPASAAPGCWCPADPGIFLVEGDGVRQSDSQGHFLGVISLMSSITLSIFFASSSPFLKVWFTFTFLAV